MPRTDACDERRERPRPVLAAQGPGLLPTARLRQPDDHGEDCRSDHPAPVRQSVLEIALKYHQMFIFD